MDYKNPLSFKQAETLLKKYISIGQYYDWLLREILLQILRRPADVHLYIQQCYELYCNGYNFLDNIGPGYGLHISVPPDEYKVASWDELDDSARKQLIDSFYPGVRNEMEKVLSWLDSGKILITGFDETAPQTYKYQDNNNEQEKQETTHKKVKLKMRC